MKWRAELIKRFNAAQAAPGTVSWIPSGDDAKDARMLHDIQIKLSRQQADEFIYQGLLLLDEYMEQKRVFVRADIRAFVSTIIQARKRLDLFIKQDIAAFEAKELKEND